MRSAIPAPDEEPTGQPSELEQTTIGEATVEAGVALIRAVTLALGALVGALGTLLAQHMLN